jgi:hypothetical protein
MERLNEINILIERLREEGDIIGSSQSNKPKEDNSIENSIDGSSGAVQ